MYIDSHMSIRILWRSTVFLLTLIFIYLAFPILIVPSSLPAINAIIVEEQYPDLPAYQQEEQNLGLPSETPDAQIYEINIKTVLTTKEKLEALKKIHQQGIDLILVRN